MSLILNIDTAVELASICLADDENILQFRSNTQPKDSATWLHLAIDDVMKSSFISIKQINAVAVSAGPGSYTGLRVAMAAGKGLCYAANIPLICISTLKMMAAAATNEKADLFCPMIDARRMEVFTAVYDKQLKEVMPPANMILINQSFAGLLEKNEIVFLGNGSRKFQKMIQNKNAKFYQITASAKDMAVLSFQKLKDKEFSDVAYSEPFYGKDFYSPIPKRKL